MAGRLPVAVVRTAQQELERLAADRLPPGTRVSVSHFFSHFGSTEDERQKFRDALRASDFGTSGDTWRSVPATRSAVMATGHHWAFTVLDATSDRLSEADATARAVAEAHGVEYNGRQVQRVGHRDSPPRIAD